MLVPPWNRVDDALIAALPGLGFTGLSLLGPRDAPASPGLARVNVHVDIVAWETHRGFAGTGQALERVVHHLAKRRAGLFDSEEPTGLMTHHLEHDAACWELVAAFVGRTPLHPAVRWLSVAELFA
ncbi:MAG: hypothetical protein GWN84_24085 [Gammaproteobacteria bacterium]|nr:hypothetical protein [Gammaproteobacteria bacterium]NIR85663.1 hypothetical protein [Gammaproteobacteria bacterium]NIR90151.1 hypothetical protein [Gammaproteobacteria bacterium]NIU06797.1 hypothetical protein [Gammaproteobacteria bacterium]NIV53730.1 hypothetical protein [Gammaproteobacteria bacterium]